MIRKGRVGLYEHETIFLMWPPPTSPTELPESHMITWHVQVRVRVRVRVRVHVHGTLPESHTTTLMCNAHAARPTWPPGQQHRAVAA